MRNQKEQEVNRIYFQGDSNLRLHIPHFVINWHAQCLASFVDTALHPSERAG